MIRDGKPVPYSGYKAGAGNILLFLLVLVLFLAMFYTIGFWDFETMWTWGVASIVLATITFFIPKALVGRADTVDTDYIYDPANRTTPDHD